MKAAFAKCQKSFCAQKASAPTSLGHSLCWADLSLSLLCSGPGGSQHFKDLRAHRSVVPPSHFIDRKSEAWNREATWPTLLAGGRSGCRNSPSPGASVHVQLSRKELGAFSDVTGSCPCVTSQRCDSDTFTSPVLQICNSASFRILPPGQHVPHKSNG